MIPPPGDLSAFYGAGAAVGLAPSQIRAMTFAEFVAVMDGFGRFHAGAADEAESTRSAFLAALADEMASGRA